MKEIAFTKVKLSYGWLGSMAPYPITYQKHVYRTAEHLFQTLRFDDEEIKCLIRSQQSPMGAKMMAKAWSSKMVVGKGSPQDLDNMRLVLRLKLEQHTDLKLQLQATKRCLLIEDCSARANGSGMFWGMARTPDGWKGDNWLGRLWMELRDG